MWKDHILTICTDAVSDSEFDVILEITISA